MPKVNRAQKQQYMEAISKGIVAKYGKTIPEWLEIMRRDSIHNKHEGEALHFLQNKYGLNRGYAAFLLKKFEASGRK